jgi:hypothetical protein
MYQITQQNRFLAYANFIAIFEHVNNMFKCACNGHESTFNDQVVYINLYEKGANLLGETFTFEDTKARLVDIMDVDDDSWPNCGNIYVESYGQSIDLYHDSFAEIHYACASITTKAKEAKMAEVHTEVSEEDYFKTTELQDRFDKLTPKAIATLINNYNERHGSSVVFCESERDLIKEIEPRDLFDDLFEENQGAIYDYISDLDSDKVLNKLDLSIDDFGSYIRSNFDDGQINEEFGDSNLRKAIEQIKDIIDETDF